MCKIVVGTNLNPRRKHFVVRMFFWPVSSPDFSSYPGNNILHLVKRVSLRNLWFSIQVYWLSVSTFCQGTLGKGTPPTFLSGNFVRRVQIIADDDVTSPIFIPLAWYTFADKFIWTDKLRTMILQIKMWQNWFICLKSIFLPDSLYVIPKLFLIDVVQS